MTTTPQQRIWRDRFDALIGSAAPALDLVLKIGERASKLLPGEDGDYYPIRPAAEALELDPGSGEATRPRVEPGD